MLLSKFKKVVMIPARLSSSRLPGKGLREILGKPLLWYLVERLKCCQNIDEIVLITSDRSEDDQLAEFAKAEKIAVFRGALDDVLGRFYYAAIEFGADVIIRANGDSPLLSPIYIDAGIKQLILNDLGFVTGKHCYTKFPVGAAPEILSLPTLRRLHFEAKTPEDREHVTSYIFSNPDCFLWTPLEVPSEYQVISSIDIAVDTLQDFCDFEDVVNLLKEEQAPANWTMNQIVKCYKQTRGETNED